jgi:hypothetical protein
MAHFRCVGSPRNSEFFVVVADKSHPTITGSIRCGEVGRDIKSSYDYLEIQSAADEGDFDEGDYEVVDSWSSGRRAD